MTQQKGYFTPREPFESQAKTGQSSLEGKNLIRQIGTYVTPVAGHAWQYAVGDWGLVVPKTVLVVVHLLY